MLVVKLVTLAPADPSSACQPETTPLWLLSGEVSARALPTHPSCNRTSGSSVWHTQPLVLPPQLRTFQATKAPRPQGHQVLSHTLSLALPAHTPSFPAGHTQHHSTTHRQPSPQP
ncbi:hypothetical protein VTJ04DRAFT_6456 [Mycothermus thermophilus]|uniref:uncharacterized protein n=1 Tax=Humicola insolens TaxID=85995 RepID=UPI003743AA89